MKKVSILIICLIVIISLVALAFAGSRLTTTNFNTCKVSCNSAMQATKKICSSEFSNNSKECKYEYESCKNISKSYLPNISKRLDTLKECTKDFNSCKLDVASEKNTCLKDSEIELRSCKNECRNCIETYEPICGKDNKSYANECFLNIKGKEKQCDGECPCLESCKFNSDCNENEFCQFDECSDLIYTEATPTATGKCVEAPEVCTNSYKPVCGCDLKNYPNDCSRMSAKVSKNHDGRCHYICTNVTNANGTNTTECSYL